jgi:hypothetical protein
VANDNKGGRNDGLPSDPAAQLEAMMEALVRVSSTEQVMNNKETRQQLEELRRRVQGVVSTVRMKLEEAEQRKRLAGEIDQLIDNVAQIRNAVGAAVSGSRDKLKAASRSDTLLKMSEALRLISDWLGNPDAAKQARVEQLIEQIRAVTGASPFYDEAAEEAKRKAELEASVKQSLDEIFGELKIKPPL